MILSVPIFLMLSCSAALEENDADPTVVMQEAKQLSVQGKNKEALEKLLWCFDEGHKKDMTFVGVRLSFVPAKIAKLGKTYPPAMEALRVRRDAAARNAKEKQGTHQESLLLWELAVLNHHLGDHAENLNLYDRVKKLNPEDPFLDYLQTLVNQPLIDVGRMDEVRAVEFQHDMQTGVPNTIERAWPRGDDRAWEKRLRMPAQPAYILNQAHYSRALAEATSDADRLRVLKDRWDEIGMAVTYCRAISNRSFYSSIEYWRSGSMIPSWVVRTDGDLTVPHDRITNGSVRVGGDCRADIGVQGGNVHILGDLSSTITISGRASEVVIGGNISSTGKIVGNGILKIFIGGDFSGIITNKMSTFIWVHGNIKGEIVPGHPSTDVRVMGDFLGTIGEGKMSLMTLNVHGFMPSKDIEGIARRGWTEFMASVAISDVPPGIYPKGMGGQPMWVVHANELWDGTQSPDPVFDPSLFESIKIVPKVQPQP